jgi:hypothetical protein
MVKLMIKKILIVASFLFVGYTIFIYARKPSHISQNQWQANMVRMQDFQYGNYTAKYVVVGTSLANRVFLFDTPEDYYNLALDGGTIYDGLEIISKKKTMPEWILIETNTIANYAISDMVKTAHLPGLSVIKRYILPLQERYQPVSIITPLLVKIYNSINSIFSPVHHASDPPPRPGIADKNKSSSKPAVQNVPAVQSKTLNKSAENKELVTALTHLDGYIDYFKKNNVRIIFFEIPHDQSPQGAPPPHVVQLRGAIRERYAPGTCDYISIPEGEKYETTDGLHLNNESAMRYRKYLLRETKRIVSR